MLQVRGVSVRTRCGSTLVTISSVAARRWVARVLLCGVAVEVGPEVASVSRVWGAAGEVAYIANARHISRTAFRIIPSFCFCISAISTRMVAPASTGCGSSSRATDSGRLVDDLL